MRNLAMMVIMPLVISCSDQNTDQENLVASNPYLIGKWTGEGNFLDVDLNKEYGKVILEIEIKEDNTIIGKIGEAQLTNTSMVEAK